jgi:hypothetical protein
MGRQAMNSSTRQLIESLHQSPWKYVLALTGGGTGALAELLEVPGGSRTIVEAVVPYSEQALVDFLCCTPEQFCAAATATAMARRAHERARWLVPGEQSAGLGCSASLATDRPKRGDHRFHVSCCRAEKTTTCSLTLIKDARARDGEEDVLDAVILNTLAECFGIGQRLDLPLLPGETLEVEEVESNGLNALFRGQQSVLVAQDGKVERPGPANRPSALLAGAFNPYHRGHRQLAETAERILGTPVCYEISVVNVDKPPLLQEEVHRRLAGFAWKAAVWLTRAPTFVQKARLFPGCVFVVGADTAERTLACRYYDGGETGLQRGLSEIAAHGCRFLVAGRADRTGKYTWLETLSIPPDFTGLFAGILPGDFRVDVSSTELRASS